MATPAFDWLLHWKFTPDEAALEIGCCCCCCCWCESITECCGEVDLLLLSSEEVLVVSVRFTVVMSWMLALLLSLPPESCLMKYFCAWLATWVGVRVITKLREMFLQSPLPYFFSPSRNNLWRNFHKP